MSDFVSKYKNMSVAELLAELDKKLDPPETDIVYWLIEYRKTHPLVKIVVVEDPQAFWLWNGANYFDLDA